MRKVKQRTTSNNNVRINESHARKFGGLVEMLDRPCALCGNNIELANVNQSRIHRCERGQQEKKEKKEREEKKSEKKTCKGKKKEQILNYHLEHRPQTQQPSWRQHVDLSWFLEDGVGQR
jgi:hypothetical protein